MDAIEVIRKGNYAIEIFYDEAGGDPYVEFDQLGTLVSFDRKSWSSKETTSNLGQWLISKLNEFGLNRDTNFYTDFEYELEYADPGDEACNKALKMLEPHIIIYPLYERGNYELGTSCASWRENDWEGFLYIHKSVAREEKGWKLLTKDRLQALEKHLLSELQEYNHYRTGNIYYYNVRDISGFDQWLADNDLDSDYEDEYLAEFLSLDHLAPDIDEGSCGGYYGYDHEKSGLLESAQYAIDSDIAEKAKQAGQLTLELA